jgi:hypothetical protein
MKRESNGKAQAPPAAVKWLQPLPLWMLRDRGLPCNADAAVNSNNSRVRANKQRSEAHLPLPTGYPQGSYKLWTKAANLTETQRMDQ